MNRVQEITGLKFFVAGKSYGFTCVSGRLKYDDQQFSVKCRVAGSDGIDEACEDAESFEVSSGKSVVIFNSITELKVGFESLSISVVDTSSISQYLIQGKGVASNA